MALASAPVLTPLELEPDDDSLSCELRNTKRLNDALASLSSDSRGAPPGASRVLTIPPGTHHIMGGVVGTSISHATINIEGRLVLSKRIE